MNSHRRQEPVLIVRLFGGLDVKQHSAPLRSLNSPRLQAFFAYLILHRQAPQSRQHIAFLFWPNSDERQAMANLRKLLNQLRQALPEADHFIDADAATIRWRPEASFTLNIAEFETALAGADAAEAAGEWQATRDALQKAVALYQGDLLPGNYDAWLASRREALYQSYLSALERLSQLLEHRGEYQEATTVTRRLLQREPLRELYYRRLMRLHALRGDRAGALAVYRECATRLQRELNVDPGPA
ncbi:MAG TPA: BTAD domain-containing putative transcriptional regulator, partial [Candidatus Sulfomarinibacteraceae bacterium]|nr:BTAD domain-containing putative transcriptional regulator [Candidatus Sulfomarinibacteraceae bacterium]